MGLITYNHITGIILDSAIEVHRHLGPGLLESVYETCLAKELNHRKLKVERQVSIPVIYKGDKLEANFRIDLLVNSIIIIELKTVEKLMPIHKAQLLSYLKLADKRLGLLINFNVPRLVDGYERVINGRID